MSGAEAAEEVKGAAMAAYVVMSLDENAASQVLRHMDEATIGAITDAMAEMKTLPNEQAYQIYARLMTDLEYSGAMTPGGFNAFRGILVKAFGDRKATEMLERIMRSNSSTIDVLTKVDSRSLAEQVSHERPQVIAVLLGQMSRASAAECLNAFPEEIATDVILRFARLDAVQHYAITELRNMLSELLGGQVAARGNPMGGVRQTADLLNGMGGGAAERALAKIRELDPDLADRIRENMFTFDDLFRLPEQSLQFVIREVDPAKRATALRAASPQMRDRVLANVAAKEAAVLRDEIENGRMVTRSDAQAAQRAFIEAALRLAQDGRISINGEEDML